MLKPPSPIAVLGAGSWGTALAVQLARNNNPVRLWGHDATEQLAMQNARENKRYLPGCIFPNSLTAISDLAAALNDTSDVLIVIPSHAFVDFLTTIKSHTRNRPVRIAWGTKGLDAKTGELLHEKIAGVFGQATSMAILSGPSFAEELGAGKPTAVSLAANDNHFGQSLITRLCNATFRVYENNDLIGVQLCGVLKNIFAIAVGITDGLQLGANARAALMTRALTEMRRFCIARGGLADTILSLAGIGDLVLTCTDDQSRNRRFGLKIGTGLSPTEASIQIGGAIEGYMNIGQVWRWIERLRLDMPICNQVYRVLYQNVTPQQALNDLLGRPLTAEY